jgi:hypothetical protein
MLTYTDVCCRMLAVERDARGLEGWRKTLKHLLTYADVC